MLDLVYALHEEDALHLLLPLRGKACTRHPPRDAGLHLCVEVRGGHLLQFGVDQALTPALMAGLDRTDHALRDLWVRVGERRACASGELVPRDEVTDLTPRIPRPPCGPSPLLPGPGDPREAELAIDAHPVAPRSHLRRTSIREHHEPKAPAAAVGGAHDARFLDPATVFKSRLQKSVGGRRRELTDKYFPLQRMTVLMTDVASASGMFSRLPSSGGHRILHAVRPGTAGEPLLLI
mmetsp:Transcript_22700/g.63067  ORF Transcript_22700/g.63067 Transcript_22700/m.63067 type:complete len:236 (+) Transcript_22700:3279-3986(+)